MANEAFLHEDLRWAIEQLRRDGVRFRLNSGYRSIAEQTRLYNLWRSGSPSQRYPVAVPGTSTHNYGLAFDASAIPPTTQTQLVRAAQRLGLVWAGPKDPVHFQMVTQSDWSNFLRNLGL